MKTSPDLFGQALTDYFHGQAKGPFLICDETGEHALDLAFYLTAEPTALETQALAHARGRILDVGCGPGRILKYLQSCGHKAIGFDIDAVAIKLCERRGVTGAVVESYHNLERFAPVDTILWLNRTLCTAGPISQIEALLQSSLSACSPGAIIILESYEVRPHLDIRGDGTRQNTLYFRYDGKIGEPFTRTYFSSNLACSVLQKTGWTDVEILRRKDKYIATARNGDNLATKL